MTRPTYPASDAMKEDDRQTYFQQLNSSYKKDLRILELEFQMKIMIHERDQLAIALDLLRGEVD